MIRLLPNRVRTVLVLLLSTLCISLPYCGAVECVGAGPCRCEMSDGTGTVDVSSLGNRDGTARFVDELSYDGTAYSYNPCFAMSLGSECKKSAVCVKQGTSYSDQGSQKSAQWSYTGYYPMVTYTTSSGRKTELLMICDPTYVNPQLTIIGELEPGIISMNLWTNCACPNTCERVDPIGSGSSSITAGSVLLILFFSGVFVYLVGGTLYNYKRKSATGKEMLPNYTFWAGFPGLVKEGCTTSWNFVCNRRSGYDEV